MKVYIDTGIFIDYLITRGHAASYLRTSARRGRSPSDLCTHAETCFQRIDKNHKGMTSSLTYYEVEEALYKELAARSTSGVPYGKRYLIPSARSVITQVLMTVKLCRLDVIDLTQAIIEEQIRNIDLQVHGVRAADSLHIITAILNDAEVLLSTDDAILDLDSKLRNKSGAILRCVDSDAALTLL